MPKQKTKSAAKKRFKLTGTGKLMHKHVFSRHNFENKSPSRRRSFRKDQELSSADSANAKRMLGLR